MIRAGLEAAGKKVHAYTSPHLARFHERIRLAGALIDEDHLTEILDECYAKNGGKRLRILKSPRRPRYWPWRAHQRITPC